MFSWVYYGFRHTHFPETARSKVANCFHKIAKSNGLFLPLIPGQRLTFFILILHLEVLFPWLPQPDIFIYVHSKWCPNCCSYIRQGLEAWIWKARALTTEKRNGRHKVRHMPVKISRVIRAWREKCAIKDKAKWKRLSKYADLRAWISFLELLYHSDIDQVTQPKCILSPL